MSIDKEKLVKKESHMAFFRMGAHFGRLLAISPLTPLKTNMTMENANDLKIYLLL